MSREEASASRELHEGSVPMSRVEVAGWCDRCGVSTLLEICGAREL
jgi:hypothetical protein